MATLQSNKIANNQPAVTSSCGGDVVSDREEIAISAALAAADVLQFLELPAGHVPVDVILDTDDLDTNGVPTITLNAGLVGGTGAEFISGSTIGQGGGMARMDQKTGPRVTASDTDRVVAVTVGTGPATGATTGTIGLTLLYRPA